MKRALLALVLTLLGSTGCTRPSEPLTAVRGRVTVRGEPLRGGVIVFVPDSERGTSGPLSYAEVRYDGSYMLGTDGSAGAHSGWHRVTVSSYDNGGISPRYRQPDLSGLAVEVRPGRENLLDFDLDS
jgi:hypothetical protein